VFRLPRNPKNICNFGFLKAATRTKIGLIPLQTKTARSYLIIGLCLLCSALSFAQDLEPNNSATPIPAKPDVQNEVVQDTLSRKRTDSLPIAKTIAQDSIKPKKESLTDKVTYTATDYERISQRLKKVFLYNEAEVTYGDMNIKAGEIIIDNETNTVFARGIKDSAGVYSQIPVFVQGPNEVEPDSILFNFKTEQALIYGSRTEDDGTGFKITNELSKRVNDSVIFMRNVKFTTSENIEDPDYYFYARRVKFVPGKKVVAGLTNMYIADVPTPIGLPFAYFPMEKNESKGVSGFQLPSPGQSNRRGYSLQNGGYYFALSPYYDLALSGDYYTNGSYAIRADTQYKKRYQFSGRFNFNYERILNSERGLPDFTERTVYNIRWNHTRDTKSSPNSRFSASVNLGSSDFFQQSVAQANNGNFLTNNFSSSISYGKTFPGKTPINVTVAATHSQNSNTQEINMSLPTVQANVDLIYPFAPKSGTKKGALQNINFSYSVRGENRVQTTDDEFFTPEMFRDMRSGVQHTVPIATNFKLFNYISASVGGSYQESWVFRTIERDYDGVLEEETTDTIRGFDSYRTWNVGGSLGTTVFGTFNLDKKQENKKIQTIRHVMRPQLSYSYRPAFDQFFDAYQRPDPTNPLDTQLSDEVIYSRFEGGIYGAPSNAKSSSVSFSLSNVLEAKVRDKDSTKTEAKKVTLLRNLNFSTSYNLTADEFQLSPLSISGSVPIIESKLDINFRATLDPYALNSSNQRINKWNIDNGGSLFRLTGASANFGYNFSSDMFNGGEPNGNRKENQTFAGGGRQDDLLGEGFDPLSQNRLYDEEEPEGPEQEIKFYNFKIPWNLRVQYQVNYGNSARQNEVTAHSIVFSGNVELGKRWTIGGNSGFDLANPGFTYTSLNFGRDLESWNLRFNWVPFSARTSWYFFIGIKSSVLSDIKYDKRRAPDERL